MAGTVGSTARQVAAPVEGAARQVARAGGPWLQRGARLGYAASGVVYLTLGAIALTGAGGGQTSSRGAIATLADKPAGTFLVLLVGIGLLGYAVWRLVEAATGAEGEGDDAKGIAKRVGHAGSGCSTARSARGRSACSPAASRPRAPATAPAPTTGRRASWRSRRAARSSRPPGSPSRATARTSCTARPRRT
jgi:hypothetical protein